jgi:NAD+ synthase (glutamine-hydrolysing)
MLGFARIAAAIPTTRIADLDLHRSRTLALIQQAHVSGCSVVCFPELGLTGYTARDLFFDRHFQDQAIENLFQLAKDTLDLAPLAIVGLPLRVEGALYNAAAAIQGGKILGIVPKAYLPNYREFEEARWFRPGVEVAEGTMISLQGHPVPFGMDLLFEAGELVVGLEICEDYWVHLPPGMFQVSSGATVICNLSASNFVIGKSELRRLLGKSASDRGKCAYLYVAAGPGESSTDLAFDADAFICENGAELACSKRFCREDQLIIADIDLEMLQHERLQTTSFGDCSRENRKSFRRVSFSANINPAGLSRKVNPHPFIPKDPATLATRCWEMFEIQTNALATRMRAAGSPRLVLGLSGGLDSTQAALVCAQSLDLLGRPRSELVCITMPGFGTTTGTKSNAEKLASSLGASFKEISISEGSRLVLEAIGHPAGATSLEELLKRVRENPKLGDVTLENVQARMRTLILMNMANMVGGLVVGTGDLSEKALGWCTYSGDHISMYDVNAGIPKTLMQFVVRWVAAERCGSWVSGDTSLLKETLGAILETPISPELLPPDAAGKIAQLTEGAIGPYELHDFFLYSFVRHGARPGRILDLALVAFEGHYDLSTLKKWLTVFYRRFFSSQFKRSCATDGPKVGMVALSPRGDWRMPSDAQVRSWLVAVESYKPA